MRLRLLTAVLTSTILLLSACSGSGSDGADDTTTSSLVAGGRTAVDGLLAACDTAMTADPPDVERLALDPAITGQIVSIPDDFVSTAATELTDCLGPASAVDYVAARLQVNGQRLPAESTACMVDHGEPVALIEFTLRRTRLEEPDPDLGATIVGALVDCVPSRFLAAPARTENELGYLLSADEACLDLVATEQPEVMETYWRFILLHNSKPDADGLTDEQVDLLVAPLYDCINTGDYISAHPSIGSALSDSSRACIGEAATDYGYWESKVAERAFDTVAYETRIASCLTPEEAFAVLGTPIPIDDPEAAHFNDVDVCFASSDLDATGAGELVAEGRSADELTTIAEALAGCAGAEGAAGRMASMTFGSRQLPKGSYDCLLPFAAASPTELLTARLLIEGGHTFSGTPADAYSEAAATCLPMNMPFRGIWLDFTSPAMANTIDFACIDKAYRDDTTAMDAYWRGTVRGGFAEGEGDALGPTDLARTAVAPLYGCVDPGRGFAALAAGQGLTVTVEAGACINERLQRSEVLEDRLIGVEPDGFNRTIADCLDEFPGDS